MIYPKYIKKGGFIGVTAPSDGLSKKLDLVRFDNSIKKLKEYGLNLIETPNVRKSLNNRSSDKKIRAKEFMNFITNDKVKYLICASGGEFLNEMIPYIDLEEIKKNPKWIQGYSDITGITYLITTKLDIATSYSFTIKPYGMEPWDKALNNSLELLEGKRNVVESSELYENSYKEYKTGLETFNLDTKNKWIALNKKECEGRIIGGCLEVIDNFIGTKYDYTTEFVERYLKDGFVWYFDIFNMDNNTIIRKLWQFKESGYFKNIKGLILGKRGFGEDYSSKSFRKDLLELFDKENISIVLEADISHKGPLMTVINGSLAKVKVEGGKGTIEYIFK